MKDYVANFHPGFVGLTGSEEEIAGVAKAYRVYYRKVEQTDPSIPYLMDHSTLIYLMGPDGAYVTHFAYYKCCRPRRGLAQGDRHLTLGRDFQMAGLLASHKLVRFDSGGRPDRAEMGRNRRALLAL